MELPCIELLESTNLEVPFKEDEIHRALMEAKRDKAPSPDVYHLDSPLFLKPIQGGYHCSVSDISWYSRVWS